MENTPTGVWMRDLFDEAVAQADAAADEVLATQVLDSSDPEYGGYRAPRELICDPRGAAHTCLQLALLWETPGSTHYRSPTLVESIRLALAFFEERAQYDDGSLDGYGAGDMKSAPITAFATFPLYDLLRRWEAIDHADSEELAGRIRRIMAKSGPALRSKRLFTHNHRWAACAAMALVNDVAPDQRLVAEIDDYLSDGIDQDDDGFYAEYSAGYGMLCNQCLLVVADKLRRPQLVDHVRRNLDLLRWLFHPNGEVACEFTYRSDQGLLGPHPVFLEMAKRDRNGLYASMAHAGFDLARRRGALGGMGLLGAVRQDDPRVDPAPLPDSYRKVFARNQIARIRRRGLSATIMGRPAHPSVPYLGKPTNENFLAVRFGEAVVDGTRITYKYYGDRSVGVPEGGLGVEGQDFVIRHEFTDHLDGPIPSRYIQFNPDLHLLVRLREIESGVAVDLDASGLPRVSVQLEFAVRPDGQLVMDGRTIPLRDGEAHYLERAPVRIVNGPDALVIDGDLAMQHRLIAPGRFTPHTRRTSLVLAVRTPYRGTLTIRGERA